MFDTAPNLKIFWTGVLQLQNSWIYMNMRLRSGWNIVFFIFWENSNNPLISHYFFTLPLQPTLIQKTLCKLDFSSKVLHVANFPQFIIVCSGSCAMWASNIEKWSCPGHVILIRVGFLLPSTSAATATINLNRKHNTAIRNIYNSV